MKLEQLHEFRQLAYEYLGNAKDATFELADAVMTTRHISCYEHQLTALPHGIPVGIIGQGYSMIALIPEYSGSWTLQLRQERITSWDNPIGFGAGQLAQVLSNFVNLINSYKQSW
ncbi:hypothetical protein [Microcoleus sp. EPA2]|uniref:hypothetical protein n=1 Tax=Microcoleus sp. EPA2 TaxID=2841654 RepID=UPI00312B97A9